MRVARPTSSRGRQALLNGLRFIFGLTTYPLILPYAWASRIGGRRPREPEKQHLITNRGGGGGGGGRGGGDVAVLTTVAAARFSVGVCGHAFEATLVEHTRKELKTLAAELAAMHRVDVEPR